MISTLRNLLLFVFAPLAIIVAIAACGISTGAFATKRQLPALANDLAQHSRLYSPQGPGPHPTVIYMHGCKLLPSHAELWGQALSANGYTMLMIDSFAHRGLDLTMQGATVCTGAQLLGRERASDLWAALYMIKNGIGLQPGQVDKSRVGAIGFSHGGWTIMDTFSHWTRGSLPTGLADESQGPDAPNAMDLSALVLVYPWCRQLSLTQEVGAWDRIPPTHFVRPTKDSVVGTTGCDDEIAALGARATGTQQGPVSSVIINATGHAFDEPDGAFIPFEQEPTDAAVRSVVKFLQANL